MSKRNMPGLMSAVALACVLGLSGCEQSPETPEQYRQQAEQALDKGDVRAAMIALRSALQQNPGDARTRIELGELYLLLTNLPAAEKEILKARDLGLPRSEWILPLGRLRLMQNKPDTLLQELQHQSGDYEDVTADVNAMYGSAWLLKGDQQKAKQLYQQALAVMENHAEARLGMTGWYMQKRRFDEALSEVNQLLQSDPRNDRAWLLKGEVLTAMNQPKVANEAFERALERRPFNLRARLQRANNAMALRDFELAKKDIELAQKFSAKNAYVQLLSGKYHYAKKNFTQAQNDLQAASSRLENHPEVNLFLGLINAHKRNWHSAEKRLSKVARTSNHPPLLLTMADVYLQGLQEPEAAIPYLQRALKTASKEQALHVYTRLGAAYAQQGLHEKAAEVLQQGLALYPDSSALRTQLALVRLNAGDPETAVAELVAASQQQQELGSSDLLLIATLIQQQKVDDAVAHAERLTQENPDNAKAFNMLGVARSAAGKIEQAKAAFNQAIELDEAFSAPRFQLARIALQQQQYDQAIEQLEEVLEQTTDVSAALAMVQAYEQKGDQERANEWLAKAWNLDKSSVPAARALIQYHLNSNEPRKAVSVANELIGKQPENAEAHYLQGKAFAANGDMVNAIVAYEKALTFDAREPAYQLALANAYARNQNDRKAESLFEKILSAKPADQRALLSQAQLAIRKGEIDKALSSAQVLKEKYPELSTGWHIAGDAYLAQRNFDRAIAEYQAALDKFKSTPLVLNLAKAFRENGDQQSSVKLLESWLNSNPRDQQVRFVLASQYHQNQQPEQAIKQYQTMLEQQPEHLLALNNLAWALQQQGNPRAVQVAEQGLKLKPTEPEILDTFGWILVKNGRVKEGLNLLDQAVTAAPNFQEAAYHAAVGYQQLGQNEKARRLLEKSLRNTASFPSRSEAEALKVQLSN